VFDARFCWLIRASIPHTQAKVWYAPTAPTSPVLACEEDEVHGRMTDLIW
jgi:hypothetical protein